MPMYTIIYEALQRPIARCLQCISGVQTAHLMAPGLSCSIAAVYQTLKGDWWHTEPAITKKPPQRVY